MFCFYETFKNQQGFIKVNKIHSFTKNQPSVKSQLFVSSSPWGYGVKPCFGAEVLHFFLFFADKEVEKEMASYFQRTSYDWLM